MLSRFPDGPLPFYISPRLKQLRRWIVQANKENSHVIPV